MKELLEAAAVVGQGVGKTNSSKTSHPKSQLFPAARTGMNNSLFTCPEGAGANGSFRSGLHLKSYNLESEMLQTQRDSAERCCDIDMLILVSHRGAAESIL